MTAPPHAGEVDEILLALAHAARAAGVGVTHDRAATFLEAASVVGVGDLEHVRRAGRATLCAGPEDLLRFEQVYAEWFAGRDDLPWRVDREEQSALVSPLPEDDGADDGEGEADALHVAASEVEVLRSRDVAAMGPRDKAVLDGMIAGLRPRLPVRRGTRRTTWVRGEIDVRTTLRSMLRQMGEPSRIHHRRRGPRTRRVVLLVDVSGSMRPYADALLRLAHGIVRAPRPGGTAGDVEVFTLGTRLTRVTEALRTRDPERALVRVGDRVPDWSGGTRLGEVLRVFLTREQTRHLARGAVVVVVSDGWERGDGIELADQLARLRRMSHLLVWVNPHRGKEGYRPVQVGIVAALPHIDAFVAGHSLRAFEDLLEVLADA
ncbi:VWA domain-containing protein [Janibacter sp. RAF52]|uniref:vWA domain-containing protein n=1 Tax=unclassified Janibacter TaxID=2649294 RepID=UPI003F8DE5B1